MSESNPVPSRNSVRLKRVDQGHYLVPGTTWEIVCDYNAAGTWSVYDGNEKIKTFPGYKEARAWAISG